jgi:hypothetical protein
LNVEHGSVFRCEGVLPGEERFARSGKQSVSDLAEYGEGQNRCNDLVGFAKLLAVGEEIAEAFLSAHELGGNDEHPAKS